MLVFIQSVLLALLFVTSVEYNLATSEGQLKVFWKPEEKMNLMKIWNRIYKGKFTGSYTQTLYKEWLKTYPDARGKSETSVLHMVNRLLNKTFVIPPEHPDQNVIRLSMNVKEKRDSGFPDYVEILPPDYEKRPQDYSQYVHTQMDLASTSGHQQTTHDVIDNKTNRKGKEKKVPFTPWETIDEINLMKAWLNVQEHRKNREYRKNLLREFERSDPKPAKRTQEGVLIKARELKKRGFVIPAEYNNGEEIRFEPEGHHTYNTWKPIEENILMKVWHSVQKYKDCRNYQDKLLEEWNHNHPGPLRRNPECVLHKARDLRRRGFVIPAEYNNGEEIRIEPSSYPKGNKKKRAESGIIEGPERSKSKSRYSKRHDQSSNQSLVIRDEIPSVSPKILNNQFSQPSPGTTSLKSREYLDEYDSEHDGPWLYLNSANDPFFKDIHDPSSSRP